MPSLYVKSIELLRSIIIATLTSIRKLFGQPRNRVSLAYTLLMMFLLTERFLADYYYHRVKFFSFPSAHVLELLAGTILLAGIIIFISLRYGRGKTEVPPRENINVEVIFTAVAIYLAYVIGLIGHMPFYDFMGHLIAYFAILLFLHLLYKAIKQRIKSDYVDLFSDFIIGSSLFALACFGFYRAAAPMVKPNDEFPRLAEFNQFWEFWKDIIIYTLLGWILLQGVYRLLLYFEGINAPKLKINSRIQIFGWYMIIIVIAVVILFGLGDMLHLQHLQKHLSIAKTDEGVRITVFQTTDYDLAVHRHNAVRVHIYIRDLVLIAFALINSIWVFYRLFPGYAAPIAESKEVK